MLNVILRAIGLKRKREYGNLIKMQYISGLQKNKVKVLSQKSSIVTAMSMEFFLTHGKKNSKTLFKSQFLKMLVNIRVSDLDGVRWERLVTAHLANKDGLL